MEVYLLILGIFLIRAFNVTLGTMRTIFSVRGRNTLSAFLSFFEVIIWFYTVKNALFNTENSLLMAISYAGGHSVGTYLGGLLSDKFMLGYLSLKIILSKKDDNVVTKLREKGYGVTVMVTTGIDKDKYVLFIEIDKKKYSELESLIKKLDNKAFVVVNEIKYVHNGYIK